MEEVDTTPIMKNALSAITVMRYLTQGVKTFAKTLDKLVPSLEKSQKKMYQWNIELGFMQIGSRETSDGLTILSNHMAQVNTDADAGIKKFKKLGNAVDQTNRKMNKQRKQQRDSNDASREIEVNSINFPSIGHSEASNADAAGNQSAPAEEPSTGGWESIKSGVLSMGKQAFSSMNQIADYGVEVDRLSQKLGMSQKEFQQWDYVLKRIGTSGEQAAGDIYGLGQMAMEAASGTGDSAELFAKLGVSVTDAGGKLKSQGQLFNETVSALQGIGDVHVRNDLASQLLGSTGEDIIPILNMTTGELKSLKENANVMDKDTIQNSVDFKNSLFDLNQGLFGLTQQLLGPALPFFNQGIQWLLGLLPQVQAVITSIYDFLANNWTWSGGLAGAGAGVGKSGTSVLAETPAGYSAPEVDMGSTITGMTQALGDNTQALNQTKGGGNTFNITVNGSDLTAEQIADKLVPRIERKLFA
ncbi:hypothetical protein [Marinicrinis lubricantis]|uniref:Phage tail tape measure protein n=1 Tax=Marinicrinis lubricantis TaxID=2086470 RepID=A0ABW1IH62_9BACL